MDALDEVSFIPVNQLHGGDEMFGCFCSRDRRFVHNDAVGGLRLRLNYQIMILPETRRGAIHTRCNPSYSRYLLGGSSRSDLKSGERSDLFPPPIGNGRCEGGYTQDLYAVRTGCFSKNPPATVSSALMGGCGS